MITDALYSALAKLKVNVKSLAEEARINRLEAARTSDIETRCALAEHRRGRLRVEARYAQLAYAFLRGRPYRQAEAKTRRGNEPCCHYIYKKVSKFVNDGFQPCDIQSWLMQ